MKLAYVTLSALLLTTACTTGVPIKPDAPPPVPPPSLKNMPLPDAVLELIQRVMKAAKTGALMDEDLALKTLGLAVVPSAKPGGKRRIITGVAALDDDHETRVYYGVNRDPSRAYKWEFSISSLGSLICVNHSNVESKLGAPQSTVFPLHGHGGGGSYLYFIYADSEKVQASFTFARTSESKRCVNDVLIRPIKR